MNRAPVEKHVGTRHLLAMILVIASFLLSGCAAWWDDDQSGNDAAACLASLGPRPTAISGVFVEPDDGYGPVTDEIRSARCTLDLTVYMLTDDVIFESLFAAANRGVQVRVILDQHPFGMFGDQQEAFDRLAEGDVEVQWARPEFQFTHAKYMIVDRQSAVIMNQNLTGAAFDSNREFGVITTSPPEVDQAQAVFDADWSGSDSAGIEGPLFVSPDNSRERLLALIQGATASIDFYAELIRDADVLHALEGAVSRGVEVRLIMNASLDPEDIASVEELVAHGVEVRLMERLYIHSKTMIIDDNRALVGSINYSMTSLDRNREMAMLVAEPALVSRIMAVYERDWVSAVPVIPAVPAAQVGGQWQRSSWWSPLPALPY